MRRLAYYLFILLIIVTLTSCAEIDFLQESDTNSVEVSDVTVSPDVTNYTATPDVTKAPESTPAVTVPDVTATPESTPEPTLKEFDVDDVIMQSTPDSSCFSEVGYDLDWKILIVKFRDSGSVYTYLDFPADEWDKFISASSLGGWYNKHIKGKYEYERIS